MNTIRWWIRRSKENCTHVALGVCDSCIKTMMLEYTNELIDTYRNNCDSGREYDSREALRLHLQI